MDNGDKFYLMKEYLKDIEFFFGLAGHQNVYKIWEHNYLINFQN